MSSSAPTGESISCQYVGGVIALALTIAPPVGEVCGLRAAAARVRPRSALSGMRPLERRDVELAHPHHGLHRTPGLGGRNGMIFRIAGSP
jgi:hypothetical protein